MVSENFLLYKRKFECKIFAETKELVHTKVLESFIFLKYLEMKYYFRPVSWYLCNISTMWQLYERTVRCECKDTFCNNTHLLIFTTDFKIVLKWPSKDFNIWESTFYLVRKGMCDERICMYPMISISKRQNWFRFYTLQKHFCW